MKVEKKDKTGMTLDEIQTQGYTENMGMLIVTSLGKWFGLALGVQ